MQQHNTYWYIHMCLSVEVDCHVCRLVIVPSAPASGGGGGILWRWTTLSAAHSVCRNASIFFYSIIIIVADVVVTIAIFRKRLSCSDRKANGKWRHWNSGVNMTCIISTFTDNWVHTVWRLCFMKSLWEHTVRVGSDIKLAVFPRWFITP